MPVRTAEAMAAQARAIKRAMRENPEAPLFIDQPRKRKQPPNPPAGSVKAKTPYYIEAEPVALTRTIKPLPKKTVVEATKQEPEGDSQEFTLISTAPDDWKYNVMTFKPANKDAKVDFSIFQTPIKMNRKKYRSQLYADAPPGDTKSTKLVPLRGPDGNPVYHNGEVVMVNAEGQTTISAAKAKVPKDVKGKGKASDATAPPKKKFNNRPKVRQVFKLDDEIRKKRQEERTTWLLEDAGSQEWVGSLDDANDSGVYAIFMINAEKGVFEFTPVHRYYGFQPKILHSTGQRADDVHQAFTSGKKIDLAAGFAKRNGGKVSSATMRTLQKAEKMEAEELKPLVKRERGESDDEGGRDELADLFDEVDYEDDVADDDDGHGRDDMAEDEDEKLAKERLKREWASARVGEPAGGEEDDDSEFEDVLNADGKRLKNALKKAGEYDSDDDDDEDYYAQRYGGKKEEDEESALPVASGVQEQARATPKLPVPAPVTSTSTKLATTTASVIPMEIDTPPNKPLSAAPAGKSTDKLSRAASPVPAGTGAALIAMRAASPKRPGGGGPLSRATSPMGRPGSPLANEAARAPSPVPAGPPKPKKVKPSAGAPAANAAGPSMAPKKAKVPIPTAKDVIDFIRASGGRVLVNDLAAKFRTKESQDVKKALIQLVKEVGKMAPKQENEPAWVSLKPEYQ